MNATQLVSLLGNTFGRERVIVRTEYHVQVTVGTDAPPHNVWLNQYGELKWRLSGVRSVEMGEPRTMIRQMRRCPAKQTNFQEMEAARALSRSIVDVQTKAAEAGITRGAFCDAGWKAGRARIAVVVILGDEIRAFIQSKEIATSDASKRAAVFYAFEKTKDIQDVLIYTDNKTIADEFKLPRVKWIPREENKTADRLGNMRGKQ
jgi:hypothetical protein